MINKTLFQNGIIVRGNIDVTGSLTIASGGITGSLEGSSSYSTTSSYILLNTSQIEVTHINGSKTYYIPSENTDIGYGNALLSASINKKHGDIIRLNSGTYDIGNNKIDMSINTSGSISLFGAGKYSTIILSSLNANLDGPVVVAGKNSITSDLTLYGNNSNPFVTQILWGIFGSNNSFENATLRNAVVCSVVDGVYFQSNVSGSNVYLDNVDIMSRYDGIVWGNVYPGTMSMHNCNVIVISTSSFNVELSSLKVSTGHIVANNCNFIASGSPVGNYSVMLLETGSGFFTSCNFNSYGNSSINIFNSGIGQCYILGSNYNALLSGSITLLGNSNYSKTASYISPSSINVPNGIVGLDSNGNISASVIPLRNIFTNLQNVVLQAGEAAYATDRSAYFVGDGTSSIKELFPTYVGLATSSVYTYYIPFKFSQGGENQAIGTGSHAGGSYTTTNGNYSHAEGYSNTTNGVGSHAEGNYTTANGAGSHAEGDSTNAMQDFSHAEGSSTVTYGYGSHAEGLSTIAVGNYSHADGEGTVASGSCQLAVGRYNIPNTASLVIIGNGTSQIARSNAATFNSQSIIFSVPLTSNVTGSLSGTATMAISASNIILPATLSGWRIYEDIPTETLFISHSTSPYGHVRVRDLTANVAVGAIEYLYAPKIQQLTEFSIDIPTDLGEDTVLHISSSRVVANGSITASAFMGDIAFAHNSETCNVAISAVSSSFATNATSASFARSASFSTSAASATSASFSPTATSLTSSRLQVNAGITASRWNNLDQRILISGGDTSGMYITGQSSAGSYKPFVFANNAVDGLASSAHQFLFSIDNSTTLQFSKAIATIGNSALPMSQSGASIHVASVTTSSVGINEYGTGLNIYNNNNTTNNITSIGFGQVSDGFSGMAKIGVQHTSRNAGSRENDIFFAPSSNNYAIERMRLYANGNLSLSGSIRVHGGVVTPCRIVSSSMAVANNDHTIVITGSTTVTLLLPTGSTSHGRNLIIRNKNTNPVYMIPVVGNTIENATASVSSTSRIQCCGDEWITL